VPYGFDIKKGFPLFKLRSARTCVWFVLSLSLVATSARAATRTVCASGCNYTDLQAAIDAASLGDTILLRAGETFVGHFKLRAKSGTGVIVIRGDAPASELPATGERLVPSTRPGGNTATSRLARIIGRGALYKTTPLLRTDAGAHGYVIQFIDFDGVSQVGYETLIQIGTDTTAAPPTDITFDRVYVHGHRYKGQKRGIALQGKRLSVLNSYISDIKAIRTDSQAINSYNGAGPFTIENNYIEGASENVMFGGADPAVSNLVPSDIVLRRNHLFKPLAWRNAILSAPGGVRASAGTGGSLAAGKHYFRVVAVMASASTTAESAPSSEVSATVVANGRVTVSWSGVSGADKYRVYRGTTAGGQSKYLETTSTSFAYSGSSEQAGSPPSSGTKWVVKNHFELKNAQRVTVEGNVLENNWAAGQAGYSIMLTPRNSGSAPWTRVQNVTFTNNIIRHVAAVVNITGYDDSDPSGRTEHITFRNNLFEDVNVSTYGTYAKALLVGNGAAYLVFDRNTIIHTNDSVLHAYGAAMPGLVYTNNLSQHRKYGIMGDGASPGKPTIAKYFPGGVVQCNVLAGGNASLYPTPNAFPTVTEWNAGFVNPSAGDYRVAPGSVLEDSGCNGAVPGANLASVNAAIGGSPVVAEPPPPGDPANLAPVADAGGPYTASVGALISVDGTGSRDPDGSVLDYLWSWGDEILVRAADLPASAIHGTQWQKVAISDAAGGAMLLNPDKGAAKRETAYLTPSSYVEFTVNVAAGVPYRLWLRSRATNNSYNNDSLYVQFSGAVDAGGAPVARIGTGSGLALILEDGRGAGVSGWGWSDAGYGTTAPPVYFAQSGPQKVWIQQREDGIGWDQLILSSAAFPSLPGATKNDSTIVDENLGTSTGVSAAHRYARPGTYPIVLTVTDSAGASAVNATTVVVR
jgi:hypothetical protein